MRRVRALCLLVAAGAAAPLVLVPVPALAARAARPYDVDGDGRSELVVGAPALEVHGRPRAGGIVVFPSGLGRRGTLLTQSTRAVVGASEDGDGFGASVVSADFDRDGYADVAVGQPGEAVGTTAGAGAVTVLPGSKRGLRGRGSSKITQPGGPRPYASFGASLAVGDFNDDAYPDLAVGAPGDERRRQDANQEASGTVTVLLGGKKGLGAEGSSTLHRVPGLVEDHSFGAFLAVGDVDADGRPDLVVLSQGQVDYDGESFRSSVSYCPVPSAGPGACQRLAFTSGGARALVLGDVQGDRRPEIVLGVPEDEEDQPGYLLVLRLSGAGGATSASAAPVEEQDLGLSPARDDYGRDFGWSLALGKVDGDRYDDLAVGAADEGRIYGGTGRVAVVRGGPDGLARTGNVWFDQDDPGVPGRSEGGDRFGEAVSLLDLDGDRRADLTVGAPGEDEQSGRVTTLRGTRSGITTAGARAAALPGAQRFDPFPARFGQVLAR